VFCLAPVPVRTSVTVLPTRCKNAVLLLLGQSRRQNRPHSGDSGSLTQEELDLQIKSCVMSEPAPGLVLPHRTGDAFVNHQANLNTTVLGTTGCHLFLPPISQSERFNVGSADFPASSF